jgi:glycosyltransferase involved in cell wall biosynthesis
MERWPLISVIIPTYNREHLLPLTLDSFLAQDYPEHLCEIIVVDNNSKDNTTEVVNGYVGKVGIPINYIFEERQGVHYARNSAGKLAKGEILFFTDDDMIADPCLLKEIARVFELDPMIGTATGLVVGKFDVAPPVWVKKYLINSYLSLTDKNKHEDLVVSRVDCGVFSCHQAIRRDVFFQSGGFNPENTAGVWIGDGETGLNIKIRRLGYKFAYTSKSIIHHMIPESRTTLRYIINRIGNEGFCDSYTDYRRHRDRRKIILSMIKRNTLGITKDLTKTIIKIAMARLTWRFFPARIMYFHNRNVYDLKLYANSDFRKAVEIDDWINNDLPINFNE